ncbi:23S rRNA (pseudouridine(1915)-N(3))-methyltransferase RlmH [Paucidesulfovibrio longus]|uniref:23S rRNA (pseudouridine(1915)-N(3))-methyltransferase RlmH n=1 Tax=Paucidesulfovibrio longus TaxID=889 RepID=UPI0003B6EED2|nr:23S rRNA (pseudouridine(1915)-N(3))-methyltransferase RlmH [Paucidesulfovibrio longus]
MRVKCLFVGKLKEPFFRDAAEHYVKKLGHFHKLEIVELKDAPSKLPPEEKRQREGRALLDALDPKDIAVILDERGKELPSRTLAANLQRWTEDPGRTPCFVIGGPFGHTDEVRKRADLLFALGKATWPHELCRVMLLEQLYRAASINRGLPYHHD